jgi:hypothetical protein
MHCISLPVKGLIDGDDLLRKEMALIISQRKALGLDGLVGRPPNGDNQYGVFQDSELRTCVLKVTGSSSFRSADFLARSRLKGENPFQEVNYRSQDRKPSGHSPGGLCLRDQGLGEIRIGTEIPRNQVPHRGYPGS